MIRRNNPALARWFDEDETHVAEAMVSVATTLETWSFQRRYANLAFARMVSGRDLPSVYGLSMTRGAQGAAQVALDLLNFRTPSFNVIGSCVETLVNKLGRNRVWMKFLSDGAPYNVRRAGRNGTDYVDGIFYARKVPQMMKLALQDCLTWGTAWAKVYEDDTDDKLPIGVERVIDDEILFDDMEALHGWPQSMYQRRFVHRERLLRAFADPKRPEVEQGILKAQGAFPGLSTFNGNASEMVALVEGWHIGEEGRHVLACGEVALVDEVWKHDSHPFQRLIYNHLGVGLRGQGLAEVLAPFQREINRLCEVISEAQKRVAVPRIFIDNASKVTNEQLANKVGGVVRGNFSGGSTFPQIATPPAVSPDMYRDRDAWIEKAYRRAGVAEDAAAGQAEHKVRSGTAERLREDIKSQRFITLGQAYEDFGADIGLACLKLAAKLRPEVKVPGREKIKWQDVKDAVDYCRIKAFPISSYPTTPQARLDEAAEQLARGDIDRTDYLRIVDYPDVRNITDLKTAAANNIDRTLSLMVEDGKYRAPDQYMDLALALTAAHARYEYERSIGTPEERIELVRRFIDQVAEMIGESQPVPQPQTTIAAGPQGMTAESTTPGAPAAAPMPAGAMPS